MEALKQDRTYNLKVWKDKAMTITISPTVNWKERKIKGIFGLVKITF